MRNGFILPICFIIGILEYGSVFVKHKGVCVCEFIEFNATAVLFIVLSIGKSFHCNITGCAGCVWLWQVGFRRVQFSPWMRCSGSYWE